MGEHILRAACALLIVPPILFSQTTMPATAPAKLDLGKYDLVWADEFDKPGPVDPANWKFENGFVRNEELQWYQPENAFCENGLLIIEAREEKPARSNPQYDPQAPAENWRRSRRFIECTSASLKTQGLHAWQYGVIEVKARIDARAGLWPAIWTLGVDKPWPFNGEVDVMEYYRGMILANVAWGSATKRGGEWHTVKKPLTEFNDPDWDKRFHVWRMEWDEQTIRLWVDDLLMNETDLRKTINPDGFNPFHQPHYIILNLALGGVGGGDLQDTQLPSRYEIDYVRVYQQK